ncbi:myocyte-specific enhancer factor 2B-like [Felis catus]|uniref:myocyte-specific enhancer factor 2B-like n=1 Tax=Felis catus TaxID=9685 RepID=UPI001D1A1F9E|nr:myocyte-specific enhancer factor 2B-like [Felis catus]
MGGQVCDSFPHPGLSGRAASRDCQLDHSQASWADSESPEGRERQARREAGLMGEPSASVSQGLSPEHDIGAFPPKGCVQPHPPAPALLATVTSDLGLTHPASPLLPPGASCSPKWFWTGQAPKWAEVPMARGQRGSLEEGLGSPQGVLLGAVALRPALPGPGLDGSNLCRLRIQRPALPPLCPPLGGCSTERGVSSVVPSRQGPGLLPGEGLTGERLGEGEGEGLLSLAWVWAGCPCPRQAADVPVGQTQGLELQATHTATREMRSFGLTASLSSALPCPLAARPLGRPGPALPGFTGRFS